MIIPILLVGALWQPRATVVRGPEPLSIARDIQRSIDREGGQTLERAWRARLAASPRAPEAVFAIATFERSRYRYERADSLYRLLDARRDSIDAGWRAMALAGMAVWRALGSDPSRADSLYTEALRIARAGGRRAIEAEVLFGTAQLRARLRGPRAGREALAQWWGALERPSPVDSAQRLCLVGAIDEQLGDTSGSHQIERGTVAAERLGEWRLAGTCRLTGAQTGERRGFVSAASYSARRALDHFRRIRYELGTALASQWYGYVQVRNSRYAQARQLLEQAIVSARATRFESVEAWAHSGLAELHLTLGDLGQARSHAAIAAASHAERGDRWGVAVARKFEGDALAASGSLTEAAARYSDAHAAFVAAGLSLNSLPVLVARAGVQLRMGQLEDAERTIALAGGLARTTEGWRNDGAVLRAELAMRRGLYAQADSLLLDTEAVRQWQLGARRLTGLNVLLHQAQVALRRDRVAVAESSLKAVTGALSEWRAQQQNRGLTASLAQLNSNWAGLTETSPDIIAQLATRGQLPLAFEFVEQLRARDIVERTLRAVAQLRDSSMALRALRPDRGAAPVVTIAELQRVLTADEAFVSFTLGIDDIATTAIVVTRDAVRAHAMPIRSALSPDILRFTQLAVAGTEAVASGRRLGQALLDPIFSALPASVTRLILSPDGELHRIPFDALRLADGRLAVERATLSSAPSATALLALRSRTGPLGDRIVALGDPTYPAPRASGPRVQSATRVATFDDVVLGRLRSSGQEARRVARYSARSTLLLQHQATEDAVRRLDWRDVGVVHFAAHALVDAESQFGTALALGPSNTADGFLSPAEIAELDLRGPLVVLSACRSSGGQVLGGEGLRGLTAPLLEAGARVVVATHWSIGDRSVVPFVDRFYAALATGMRVDDALRQAKLSAIRAGVSIADWGSFVAIGDGALRVPLRQPTLSPIDWLRDITQPRRDSGGP